MMQFVTFTTDFGHRDYFLGALKGQILSGGKVTSCIDISNAIDAHNILQAAFVLKNCYADFPVGSIHIIGVHTYYKEKPNFLVIEENGHFFIGPDNGVFSLMFEDLPKAIWELDFNLELSACNIKWIYSKGTEAILAYKATEQSIGALKVDYLQRLMLLPVTSKDFIRGAVIYIDNYKNAIINIDKELFERIGQGRSFKLFFKRNDPLKFISNNYASVGMGEPLCFFNSAGFLEIAVNLGEAATLYGLEIDEAIQIDFLNEP